tara:strand:- start:1016 stop:1966 length:951 start_codon:yes stop_codon:yes gene_type:complete
MIYNICEGGGNYGMGHVVRSFSFCNLILIQNKVKSFIKINIDIEEAKKINFYFKNYKLISDEIRIFEEIEKNSIVIFDGYHFNIKLINQLSKKLSWKIIFISDVHKKVPNCEVLINHLPYVKETFFKAKVKTKLIGTNYSILRKPFYKKSNGIIKDRVLICLGNYKVSNILKNIYNSLIKFGFECSKIDIIFTNKIKGVPSQNIYRNISALKVYKLISKSKLCFITPGNISYEVFSINRNCIIGSISKSQISPAKEFEKMGLCVNIGEWGKANFNNIDKWIKKSSITALNQKNNFNKLSEDNLRIKLSYLNLQQYE